MPRYPYRDLGTKLNRDFRNNLNANFDDVEADVKDLDTRIDNIVAQAGSDNTEIVDARYDSINNVTHPTLKDRLDDTSNKIGILSGKMLETKDGQPAIAYAGVIRNSGSGWNYIEDTIHQKINFNDISVTENNEIMVTFPTASKVGSLIVAPDETLASYGLLCGASVGTNTAFIKCYAPFTGYIDGSGTIAINNWFNGAYTVTPLGDGTGFTINYDGAGNAQEKVLATIVRDSAPPHNGLDIRAARGGAGQAILRAYHDLYAYVYYDGSAWQVVTSCVANITASFDSGTGILTITHDGMNATSGYNEFQSVSLTPRKGLSGGLIHPRINQVTQTQIKVEFYNNAGTLLTSPNTDMRIFVARPGFRVPHIWNSGTRAYFDFGYSVVRPNNLISGPGNLWIIGIHNK